MKTIVTDFPNPILINGGHDYAEDCSFNIVLNSGEIKVDSENIRIPVSYNLNCACLSKLIEEKKATVIITERSSSASFLNTAKFNHNSQSMILKIPKYYVTKNLELKGSIIALQDIKKFSGGSEWNEKYFGSYHFDFEKGDVFALANTITVNFDTESYETSTSSVFRIEEIDQKNDSEKGKSFITDFESNDYIYIKLSSDICNDYKKIGAIKNGKLKMSRVCMVVLPVLVEALQKIQYSYMWEDENTFDYKDTNWGKTIESRANDIGYDLSDTEQLVNYTECADKMLNGILSDSLNALVDFCAKSIIGEEKPKGGK